MAPRSTTSTRRLLLRCILIAVWPVFNCWGVEGTPKCGVDAATLSPSQLTLTRWNTQTLTCAHVSPCDALQTVFILLQPPDQNRDKIELLTNRTFSSIVAGFRANAVNCSYEVDLSWTDDEVIRSDVHSGIVTCLLVFGNGSTCETDSHASVEISDLWANTTVEISPDRELLIDRGGSSELSCTAPCSIHGDEIELFLFNYLTKDNEEVRSNALKSILGDVEFMQTSTNCSYAVNISYSLDEEIRRTLSVVRCTFVYSGSPTIIHRSHPIRIIFTGDRTGTTSSGLNTESSSSSYTDSDSKRTSTSDSSCKQNNINNSMILLLILFTVLSHACLT